MLATYPEYTSDKTYTCEPNLDQYNYDLYIVGYSMRYEDNTPIVDCYIRTKEAILRTYNIDEDALNKLRTPINGRKRSLIFDEKYKVYALYRYDDIITCNVVNLYMNNIKYIMACNAYLRQIA